METAKEKEFSLTIFNISIVITICISVLLYIAEGIKKNIQNEVEALALIVEYIPNKVFNLEKNILISFLLISTIVLAILTQPKPSLKASKMSGFWYILVAFVCYVGLLQLDSRLDAYIYLGLLLFVSVVLIICMVKAGVIFNSIIYQPKQKDIFNRLNEQFPQNNQMYDNDMSVTYLHQYSFRGKWFTGIVPVISPERAVLVIGGQGSGKTYTVFNPAINQCIEKGYSIFCYDYAYPDLSITVLNALVNTLSSNKYAFGKDGNGNPIIPEFNVLDFEDLRKTSRCNPFEKKYMRTLDECNTMVKNLLYNLNRSWISQEGDFWAVSAVNLLTSVLWLLRIIEEHPDNKHYKKICTLPHAILLLTTDFKMLVDSMDCIDELRPYANMFSQGLKNQAGSQIAGQIASVQAGLAPLSSANVSWVMSDTDLDMDLVINDPKKPRIITMGNYTPKSSAYGAAISVYTSVIMKESYKNRDQKFSLFLDELPTIYINKLDDYIATIRKHRGAVWMGIQDYEQLVKNFGKQQAEIMLNTAGTVLCGQVNGATAEKVSKMFGKSEQQNVSTSVNKENPSFSFSTQAKELLPASKIMTLSQGHFVGKFADRFDTPIDKKLFSGFFSVPSVNQRVNEIPLKYNITDSDMQKKANDNMEKIRKEVREVEKFMASTYL